jgi:large subunit ribosomal protein L32
MGLGQALLLPRLASSPASFLARHLPALSLLPSITLAIPASIQLELPSVPSLLEGIWESILRAVPKKKTTHSKKRHRLLAGKALKDVTALCRCPACGEIKRMHYLCPHCATSKSLRHLISGLAPTHSLFLELREMMSTDKKATTTAEP